MSRSMQAGATYHPTSITLHQLFIATVAALALAVIGFARTGLAEDGKSDYFTIRVVDEATGRGVPLVELRTVNQQRYITDSAGVVAYHEPGLMDADVFFTVSSHGYEFPADGFGIRGQRLRTSPGGRAELKVARKNIAERLYRVTGAGIYRDSLLVGEAPAHVRPEPAGKVLGCDSVVQAFYRGKLFWFWGDTQRASYPLGNFHVPGAVSQLPTDGGLPPDQGVALGYFLAADGFAAETCRMKGDGPTWIGGLTVIKSSDGEHLYAGYVKVRNQLHVYARGIAKFNDEKNAFEHVLEVPLDEPLYPRGHPFQYAVGGVEYIYFADAFPLSRVRATDGDFLNLAAYEAYTCLLPGSSIEAPKIDRDERGRVRYAWRKNAAPVGAGEQQRLTAAGALRAVEGLFQLRDAKTGKPIVAHAGSVAYNAWRKKWVAIFCELGGSSMLGETWFAEADTPLGPWCYAVKIVSHNDYSFYNPRHHPRFDEEGGRRIYFEGTYTHTFSGNKHPTPAYDYNQIMYRLDLADERLALPSPIYRRNDSTGQKLARGVDLDLEKPLPKIAFFALDRPVRGAVPIDLVENGEGIQSPLFYALAADAEVAPESTALLYRYSSASGETIYATQGDEPPEGFEREENPICRVWISPWHDAPYANASQE